MLLNLFNNLWNTPCILKILKSEITLENTTGNNWNTPCFFNILKNYNCKTVSHITFEKKQQI